MIRSGSITVCDLESLDTRSRQRDTSYPSRSRFDAKRRGVVAIVLDRAGCGSRRVRRHAISGVAPATVDRERRDRSSITARAPRVGASSIQTRPPHASAI